LGTTVSLPSCTGIAQYVSFFGGMETPFFIPSIKLALGFSAIQGHCLWAALWPLSRPAESSR
jgi:hypothetical protein